MQLHGEGKSRDDEGQREDEDAYQSRGAPDQPLVFDSGAARALSTDVGPPQEREQREVGDPRPHWPLRGKQRVLGRHRLQPHPIHLCHRCSKGARDERPGTDHGSGHCGGQGQTPQCWLQPDEGDANQDREPQTGRDMNQRRGPDERDAEPHPAPQQRRHREQAQSECEHARVDIRLERVRTRPRNAVAQCQRRKNGDDDPWCGRDALPDEHQRDPYQRH